jgi:O-antigen ligase
MAYGTADERKRALVARCTQILLFINTFAAETTFRLRAYDDKSLDLQVLIKLGVWAATLVFCVAFFRLWGKRMLRVDNFFQVVLLALIVLSCFYAVNVPFSLACAFSLIAVFCLLFMSSAVLTNREIIAPIIGGGTLVSVISILVYFLIPEFGRMKEWHGGELVPGPRLAGITGTANVIGYISAFSCMALYYYRRYLPQKIPLSFWVVLAINVLALVMSNSRTSMLALAGAIAIAGLFRASPAKLASLFAGVCVVIIFCLTADLHTVFALLSRSGDASEILTATGRFSVWEVALKLIAERPLLGWGYGSMNFVLPALSSEVGFAAAHAHNAFLQVFLSIGLLGLCCFILVMGLKIYFSVKSKDQLNIAAIFFLLIDGLTEVIAFQGPATTTTLMLAVVLSLNYRAVDDADKTPYQQRVSQPAGI